MTELEMKKIDLLQEVIDNICEYLTPIYEDTQDEVIGDVIHETYILHPKFHQNPKILDVLYESIQNEDILTNIDSFMKAMNKPQVLSLIVLKKELQDKGLPKDDIALKLDDLVQKYTDGKFKLADLLVRDTPTINSTDTDNDNNDADLDNDGDDDLRPDNPDMITKHDDGEFIDITELGENVQFIDEDDTLDLSEFELKFDD